MTLCGHTFCSLCIRRALNADGRCPSCRSLEEESKLRKNLMIEEIVEAFLPFRESLMKYAPAPDDHSSASTEPGSEGIACVGTDQRTVLDVCKDEVASPSPVSQRARVTRASRNRERASTQLHSPSPQTEQDPPRGHISCPICQRHVHQDKADSHVNRCIEGKASPPPSPKTFQGAVRGSNSPYFSDPIAEGPSRDNRDSSIKSRSAQPTGHGQEMKRLAKISYNVMNDAKLRKTMADLGISTTGNRTQLQRRCTEFIAMWNSNLDSSHPKTRKDLLHDMKAWDRIQARPINKITNDEIDYANQKGLYDDDFADLVSKARDSLKKRKAIDASEAGKMTSSADAAEPEAKRQQI